LAQKTGAPIIYGPKADPSFDAYIAKDEEVFKLGDIKIKVLYTPGHTMESTTYLVIDEQGKEHAIFTGDTLFLGDVGRPDLAQKSDELTMEDLAGYSFDSLRNKIMPLPNEVIVYPAHGAGSACGKNMMKETVDTLGNQKKMNYALRADMTKEEFIKEVTDELLPPPAYFPLNVKINKEGYADIEEVLSSGLNGLTPDEFEKMANETEVVMLDVRSPFDYATGHIPNSIFIGLDGSFAPWVVGFDNTLGFLLGGIDEWEDAAKELDIVISVSATQLNHDYLEYQSRIYDVRKESEYLSEHIVDAKNTPLSKLNTHLEKLPKADKFYVHCAGGYRSMIASSILKSRGYHNLINVEGGFKAIKETGVPKSDFVCPTTL